MDPLSASRNNHQSRPIPSLSQQVPRHDQRPRKRRSEDNDDARDEASSSFLRIAPHTSHKAQNPTPKNKRLKPGIVDEPIHRMGKLPPFESIDNSCAFITLSDTTSDETCRTETHLPGGVSDLVKRLEAAAKATEALVSHGWDARKEIYSRTSVLLLSWADDDLQVQTEIRQLRSLFADTYHYNVCEWELPSGHGVYQKTINKVGEFAAEHGGEGTLLIIYYGGHGYQDLARPSSGPIWISRRRRDGDSVKPTELESSGLLPILAEQEGDVLLIFDCCQAVPPIVRPKGKGVVSALSATGFEAGHLGIAPEPGVHSFTHALVDELAITTNIFRVSPNPQPVSDIELHVRLVTRLRQSAPSVRRELDGSLKRNEDDLVCFERQNRRTPHYQFLSAGRDPRPIYLQPNISKKHLSKSASQSPDSGIDTGSTVEPGTLTAPSAQSTPAPAPMVLIRVMLSLDDFDVQEWASWILKCPEAAARVKIEGQWGSFSTLQIIRLPLDLWDLVPKHPAISFIGFVTTENQAGITNEAVAVRVSELRTEEQQSLVKSGTYVAIPKNTPSASCIYPTLPENEMRSLLSEMIKTSSVDVASLKHFIQTHKVRPNWPLMQLPAGHNMSQCIRAVGRLMTTNTPTTNSTANALIQSSSSPTKRERLLLSTSALPSSAKPMPHVPHVPPDPYLNSLRRIFLLSRGLSSSSNNHPQSHHHPPSPLDHTDTPASDTTIVL